jgi:hypothetical protein
MWKIKHDKHLSKDAVYYISKSIASACLAKNQPETGAESLRTQYPEWISLA